jgi:hypothetical protein
MLATSLRIPDHSHRVVVINNLSADLLFDQLLIIAPIDKALTIQLD